MNIILRPRQSGKTTELIRKSARDGGLIVCHSKREAKRIFDHAQELGLRIRMPITYAEFMHDKEATLGYESIHIDNVETMLRMMAPGKIKTITISTDDANTLN